MGLAPGGLAVLGVKCSTWSIVNRDLASIMIAPAFVVSSHIPECVSHSLSLGGTSKRSKSRPLGDKLLSAFCYTVWAKGCEGKNCFLHACMHVLSAVLTACLPQAREGRAGWKSHGGSSWGLTVLTIVLGVRSLSS